MQVGAASASREKLQDAIAANSLDISHAAALVGKWKLSVKFSEKADAIILAEEKMIDTSTGNGKSNSDNVSLFKVTNRQEMLLESTRIRAFSRNIIDRVRKLLKKRKRESRESHRGNGSMTAKKRREVKLQAFVNARSIQNKVLINCMKQTFILSANTISGEQESAVSSVHEDVTNALSKSLGLNELIRLGETSLTDMEKAMSKCFNCKHRIRWKTVFRKRKKTDEIKTLVPIKLEICSGNGDWIVGQAEADQKSNYVALELKYDRVFSIFSRMFMMSMNSVTFNESASFKGSSNLAIIGGDACKILPAHFMKESVGCIFINFPEPPHWSGDGSLVAESENHLLTTSFFLAMHRVLVSSGKLVIFSDNRKYLRLLAEKLSVLPMQCRDDSQKDTCKFVNVDGVKASAFEEIVSKGSENMIKLYSGTPGPDCGYIVNVSSFFDRFWQNGEYLDRAFLVVQKP